MSKQTSSTSPATVKISPRGASRLKDGRVWVYRSDIVSAEGVPAGSLVSVVDHRGHRLGSALSSTSSQLAIRMISEQPVGAFPALLRPRLPDASAYREAMLRDTHAYPAVSRLADFRP